MERGAAKVYAAVRNLDSVDLPGVVPLRLDITDPASVAAAVAGDVTLLINNAGFDTHTPRVGRSRPVDQQVSHVHTAAGTVSTTGRLSPWRATMMGHDARLG